MNNEELEKKMEFIVGVQAQFASDVQQLSESQSALLTAHIKTEQAVVQTGEIVARLANATLEGFKDVNAKIDALVDAQIRTEEKFNRTDEKFNQTDEKFKQLADAHTNTEADLRKLIAVVDRHISEGRNGN